MNILSIDFDYVLTGDIKKCTDVSVNKDAYSKVLHIIREHPRTKVVIADDHHEIVHLLRDTLHLRGITLYNVDYHHDIVYHTRYRMTCGNWASRLIVSGEVGKYYWIPQVGSSRYKGPIPYEITTLDNVAKQQFDLIFICKSSLWLPRCFDYLFDNLIDTVKAHHDMEVIQDPGRNNRERI